MPKLTTARVWLARYILSLWLLYPCKYLLDTCQARTTDGLEGNDPTQRKTKKKKKVKMEVIKSRWLAAVSEEEEEEETIKHTHA